MILVSQRNDDNDDLNEILHYIMKKVDMIENKLAVIETKLKNHEKLIYAILGFLVSILLTLIQVMH